MSSYELTLTNEFSAAHRLRMYDGHLEPLHGHNWKVELSLAGQHLDEIEVVADFTQLRRQLQEIIGGLHDCYLNEHPAFHAVNPSTERVAQYIGEQFLRVMGPGLTLLRVRVWETADCAAAYIP